MQIIGNRFGFLFLGFALFFSLPALAQNSGSASKGSAPWSFMNRKAEVKRQSRWSLDEWMATREKYRWQDMWLALNSPSPFEFFVTGSANLIPITRQAKTDLRYGVGAYVSIFGLEFEHDHVLNPEDHARFHLRVFGYNVQNTNLTLQGGVRFQQTSTEYRQWYVGASTSIYLHKYFGIYGLYRYYLDSVSVPGRGVLSGVRAEAGPFIDFGPLRIFGYYVYEQDQNADLSWKAVSNGWSAGGQLFF